MTMNSPSEKRLEELREQAWKEGVVAGKGVDVAGGPIPRKPGYYGQPVVKPPVWTWQVPLYFFFGGIAGMSAVIASGAIIFHHSDLALAAMWKKSRDARFARRTMDTSPFRTPIRPGETEIRNSKFEIRNWSGSRCVRAMAAR